MQQFRKKIRINIDVNCIYNTNSQPNLLMNMVMFSDTYFGLILEFLTSLEFIRSISLLTRYHYNFIRQRSNNFQIILRILNREFFDLHQHPLLCTSPNDVYSMIYLLYNFWRDFDELLLKCNYLTNTNKSNNADIVAFISQPFLSRWCVLDRSFHLYSAKYWVKSISNSLKIPIKYLSYHIATRTMIDIRTIPKNNNNNNNEHDIDDNDADDVQLVLNRKNMHISTAILQHHCCRDDASPNIDQYKYFMEWSIINGYNPNINDFKPLISSIIHYLKHDKHRMFSWCMNYSCKYFEKLRSKPSESSIVSESENADDIDIGVQFFVFICFILNQINQFYGDLLQKMYEMELMEFEKYLKEHNIINRMKKLWQDMKYDDIEEMREFLTEMLDLKNNSIQFMDIIGLKQ